MSRYLRPASLDEALAIRAGGEVTVLAGGTDIYPALTARAAWGDPVRGVMLDISGLDALRGIARTREGWRFGALTTWSMLADAELPPLFDGWRAAAREVGGRQVQNRATLAGNLCTASPAGDGIPCLMALDAEIELASLRGRRLLPINQFITGYRQTAILPDEIVVAIHVPNAPPGSRSAFLKLGSRRYLVISIAMVAGTLACGADGAISQARLAVGACGPVATRLPALEAQLVGVRPDRAAALVAPGHLAELAPIDDIRSSGEHRRQAALTLLRDLLERLATAPMERAA